MLRLVIRFGGTAVPSHSPAACCQLKNEVMWSGSMLGAAGAMTVSMRLPRPQTRLRSSSEPLQIYTSLPTVTTRLRTKVGG
jgi:hypothetical protein